MILAGGNGLPRRGLTPAYLRGKRPPHFCMTVPGGYYVINETRKQLSLVFAPENTMIVVRRGHSRYYKQVLRNVPPENLIVEPQDDGNVFAVLYAALRVGQMNPSAVAAFFPPDFRVGNEREFASRIAAAAGAAQNRNDLILLGAQPNRADVERDAAAFDFWNWTSNEARK